MRLQFEGDVDELTDFEVGFLDAWGALNRTVPVAAKNVTVATWPAGEIASEIEAVDFYITSKSGYPQH